MHYVSESPHMLRSTNVCVCVCNIWAGVEGSISRLQEVSRFLLCWDLLGTACSLPWKNAFVTVSE